MISRQLKLSVDNINIRFSNLNDQIGLRVDYLYPFIMLKIKTLT